MDEAENHEDFDLLTDEQRQLLDDRFRAHRLALETSIPWEEVKARLLALE